MNKLELLNEKVHAMAQVIEQQSLNEQLFTKKLQDMEARMTEKIEDANINIQVC